MLGAPLLLFRASIFSFNTGVSFVFMMGDFEDAGAGIYFSRVLNA